MTNDAEGSERDKRPYAKPEIRRVRLEPEESFAAGCKTVASSSPSGLTCDANSCFNLGS